ncbi:MAG: hypothetical protein WKF70_09880 [Chitinophagaceae bacterium]
MKKLRQIFVLLSLTIATQLVAAQDTLPRFTVVNKGNERIVISWTNPYENSIRQLSIQRSFDSLKNYRTILTVVDPTVPQNGYVDTKATNDHMFYRLFILRDSGKYIFSVAKRPVIDAGFTNTDFDNSTTSGMSNGITRMRDINDLREEAKQKNERLIFIKNRETLLGAIRESALKRFRDSLNLETKDTVFMKTADTLVIRPLVSKGYFKPSRFVFTEKDGNIKILLTDAASRKYEIRFFEEDNSEVFELKNVREPLVILDKANFVHSGWFNFELYEDGKLKEKHRFYVPKDF